jgi:hypothetical protein
MSPTIVTEQDIRERLKSAGKSDEETDGLIQEYLAASHESVPDEQAISLILRRSQEDSVLRVRAFQLTRDQYDTLANHLEESGDLPAGHDAEAGLLVNKALEQFIDLIS